MSHLLLELAIKLHQTEINQYIDFDDYKDICSSHKIYNHPQKCWVSTTHGDFWFRIMREETNFKHKILIKIIDEKSILLIERMNQYKNFTDIIHRIELNINEIEDIQLNFMIDGKLDSASFVLAYGRNHNDELFDFNKVDYDIFSKFLNPIMEGVLK